MAGCGARASWAESRLATESFYYDENPLTRLGVEEISLDVLREFLDQDQAGRVGTLLEIEAARLLRSWRLASGGRPTVAGILLFGRNPQAHLPFAQINAARIPGIDLANEPSDRKDLTGRLLDVIDQAMRFGCATQEWKNCRSALTRDQADQGVGCGPGVRLTRCYQRAPKGPRELGRSSH